MANVTLALDLGPGSIGWALVERSDAGNPDRVVDAGVRIYGTGADPKSQEPLSRVRRVKRGARRTIQRRARRRALVREILTRGGLLPADLDAPLEKVLNDLGDPYELRARALDHRLEPFEIGRAISHLGERRGFRSNRKTKRSGEKDADREEGAIKAGIRELAERIKAEGCRTLGEFLAKVTDGRRRALHTDRAMYASEFEAIWSAQSRHHPHLLTPDLKANLYRAIFFQRPVKTKKGAIGKCSFLPNRPRGAWGLPVAQRVRLLQTVNIIEVRESATSRSRPLTPDERGRLLTALATQASMTWPKVRKLLGLPGTADFNLQDEKRDKLLGDTTGARIHGAIGDRWTALSDAEREALATDLLTIENVEPLRRRLESHWGLDAESAGRLVTVELQPGRASLSTSAMRRLLPHLEAGMNYHDACQAAGFLRPDQRPVTVLERLPSPPDLPNPVVRKALHQVRRLVNAILRTYGRPDVIRVELARDLRLSPRQRSEVNSRQSRDQRARDEARARLKSEFRQHFADRDPSRADVDKLLLWQECRQVCVYSGRQIPASALLSPEVHVDHILPYSRSLDDSFGNKVLCYADVNVHEKGNRTPWEAWHGDSERFHQILTRARHLPPGKRRRFSLEELSDGDVTATRLLNDTRYISTEVRGYLQKLGMAVEISKGGATAALRRKWELNLLLNDTNSKNRGDHRHHAVDAVVIALTDHGLLSRISRASASHDGVGIWDRRLLIGGLPAGFLESLKSRIASMVVSHESDRGIRGALHEETAYGFSEATGELVYRKSLDSELKQAEIERIRDPIVRRLVEDRLNGHGGRWKEAFAAPLVHVDGRTQIRRVRLTAKLKEDSVFFVDRDGRRSTGYKTGSNHHVEILEDVDTGKWMGVVVSMVEAANRVRRDRVPVVQREHGPRYRFVMSLGIDECVRLTDSGQDRIYRVQNIEAGDAPRPRLKSVEIADRDSRAGEVRKLFEPLRKLDMHKVAVDILGRVADAND